MVIVTKCPPVWAAWMTPEHVSKWFTPAPWTVIDYEIDLLPGGTFRTVMRSPDGKEQPNIGCYLEIITADAGPALRHLFRAGT